MKKNYPRKNIQQRLLSIRDASVYLGRSEVAIRRLINKGMIRFVRADRRIQIDIQDLDDFIESNKERFTY